MKGLRKEIHEFIRAAEALSSSGSFDTPLTRDERLIIGMYAQDLCNRYPLPEAGGIEGLDGKSPSEQGVAGDGM
jgi:hypothetical protein